MFGFPSQQVSFPVRGDAAAAWRALVRQIEPETKTPTPDTLVGTATDSTVFVRLTGERDMGRAATFEGRRDPAAAELRGVIRIAESTVMRMLAIDVGVFFVFGVGYLVLLMRGGGEMGPWQWAALAVLVPAVFLLAAWLDWWIARGPRAELIARIRAALAAGG